MKTIKLADLELKKIENRKGLYQMDIVDRQVGAESFSFHLSVMEEDGIGSLHSHPHSEHLLMVVKGELELRNDRETQRVPAGAAVLVFPGEDHEVVNVFSGASEYYVIYSPPR